MSYESSNGLGVKTAYGPKKAGDYIVVGGHHAEGALQTVAVKFDYSQLGSAFLDTYLPVGAQVVSATMKVVTAFVGAGGIVEIGVSWVVANIGTDNRTVAGAAAAGTWANPLAAATKVGLVASGGTFTAGVGTINLVYRMG